MGNPRARPKGGGGRARILAANNCGSKNCARHNIITFGCCGGLAKGVSRRRRHRLRRCSYATKLRPEAFVQRSPAFASHRRLRPENRQQSCVYILLFANCRDKVAVLQNRASRNLRRRRLALLPSAGSAPQNLQKYNKRTPFGKLQVSIFWLSLLHIFDFVQDTPVRQIASKLAFALTYSYLCCAEGTKWLRLEHSMLQACRPCGRRNERCRCSATM